MFKIKSALSAKVQCGPGGVECGCCGSEKLGRLDKAKRYTARVERRKARMTNWFRE